MALNTEKNSYTLLFAIGLVVIVGTLLASVDASLKEKIKVNKVLEKQQIKNLGIPLDTRNQIKQTFMVLILLILNTENPIAYLINLIHGTKLG